MERLFSETGDRLTPPGNNSETFSEGQAIELEATLVNDERECYKIIIRDGLSIDVLGSGELLPATVLGTYIPMDRELFMWSLRRKAILGRKERNI